VNTQQSDFMESDETVCPLYEKLLKRGQEIFSRLEKLDSNPSASSKLEMDWRRWLNDIRHDVLPNSLEDESVLKEMLGWINRQGVRRGANWNKPYFEHVFKVIQSASAPTNSSDATSAIPTSRYKPGTAFILMWMDKNHPELDDVANAIKDVCHSFDIRAIRADDVEHADRITDLILENIRNAEFLIADLTGERPNVYYEIGFAHAIGKRPILYRKEGTKLHFDLSVHNVPEYRNVTELKELLTKRFEALLGRAPKQLEAMP
jgi:hypothetical protein